MDDVADAFEYQKVFVPFSVTKAHFETDADDYEVEGLASTFGNIDLQGDIIEQGAFLDSLTVLRADAERRNGPLLPALWNHNSFDPPIGRFVELHETDLGLHARALLPKDDDLVRGRVWPQLRTKSVGAMSIGFWIEAKRNEGVVRHIEKARLVEISLTPFPANPKARISSVKNELPILTSDDLEDLDDEALEKQLRSGVPLSKRLSKLVAYELKSQRRKAAEIADGRKARLVDEEKAGIEAIRFDAMLRLAQALSP